MNIYLISQDEIEWTGSYSSAVVIAEDEDKARATHPSGSVRLKVEGGKFVPKNKYVRYDGDYRVLDGWVRETEYIRVELIGKAKEGSEPRVVCAEFNVI